MTMFSTNEINTIPLLAILLDATIKGLVLVVFAWGASRLLGKVSAAGRHTLWSLTVVALLTLPFLSAALPQWQIPVLPEWTRDLPAEQQAQELPLEQQPEETNSASILQGKTEILRGGFYEKPLPPRPYETGATSLSEQDDSEIDVSLLLPNMAKNAAERDSHRAKTILTPTSRHARSWPAWVMLAWAGGAAVVLLPLLLGSFAAWRCVQRATPVTDESWLTLLTELSASLQLHRWVQLRRSGGDDIPAVFGVFRPTILIPAGADDWPEQRRRVVLLHELAHVKRRDCLTQLLAQLACVVYWFNPPAWLVARQLRIERERACDDLVLTAGQRPSEYADHLLEMVRTLRSRACPSFAAVAMAKKSNFEHRLLAILDAARPRQTLTKAATTIAFFTAVAILLPLSMLHVTVKKPATPATQNSAINAEGVEGEQKNITPPNSKPEAAADDTSNNQPTTQPAASAESQSVQYGGVVKNEQGQPIEGATVSVLLAGFRTEDGIKQWQEWQVQTDKAGCWKTPPAPKWNDVWVRFAHPDYISDDVYGQSGKFDADTLIKGKASVVLKRGLVLSGRVMDEKGQPVEGADVRQGQDRWGTEFPATSTDKEGRFHFPSARPGQMFLTVQKEGYAPALQQIHLDTDTKPLTFRLGKGHTVRGRVVDADGKGIAGVRVVADTWRQGTRTLGWEQYTDQDGRFAWRDAPADTVLFDMVKQDLMSIRGKAMSPSDTEYVITMHSSLQVHGRVIDKQTGQPVTKFNLIPGIKWDKNQLVYWDRMHSKRIESSQGQYELQFDFPRVGHYVRIEAPGYNPAVSRVIRDDEGDVTVDFSLEKGVGLSGVVLQPDGKPAVGAKMIVCTPSERGYVRNGHEFLHREHNEIKTDKDGRYRIEPQDDTKWTLVVLHDTGYAELDKSRLKKAADISLKAWSCVEGTLMIGAKPGVDEEISISSDRSDDPRRESCVYYEIKAKTDRNGRFRADRVRAGRIGVSRMVMLGNVGARFISEQVEIKPGQTVEVKLGGTGRPIVGRLTPPLGYVGTIDWTKGFLSVRTKRDYPQVPVPDDVKSLPQKEQMAWYAKWCQSEEGKAYQKKMEDVQRTQNHFGFFPKSDGSFRVEDVPAGEYELSVQLHEPPKDRQCGIGDLIGYLNYTFTVPEMPSGRSDEPLDIGTHQLKRADPQQGNPLEKDYVTQPSTSTSQPTATQPAAQPTTKPSPAAQPALGNQAVSDAERAGQWRRIHFGDCKTVSSPATMTSRVEFGKKIPVLLAGGAGDDPSVLRLAFVMFEKTNDSITAKLYSQILSYPKAKWRIAMELQLAGEKTIRKEIVVENLGFISSYPLASEGYYPFAFEKPQNTAGDLKFRVRLESVGNDVPVTGELTTPDYRAFEKLQPNYGKTSGKGTIAVAIPPMPVRTNVQTKLWRKDCEVVGWDTLFEFASGQPLYWDTPEGRYGCVHIWGGSSEEGAEFVQPDIPYGTYRLSDYSDPSWGKNTFLVGVTGPMELTEKNTRADAKMEWYDKASLTIRLVHPHTGKPSVSVPLVIRMPNGLPVETRSNEQGVVNLKCLPAGKITLELGPRDWWSTIHPEVIKTVAVDLQAGESKTLEVKYFPDRPTYLCTVATTGNEKKTDASKTQATFQSAVHPGDVAGVLDSLKAELVNVSEEYPELAGVKEVQIRAEGAVWEWNYEHNCKYWGKRGYEDTGPNAAAVVFRVMTEDQYRKDLQTKEMQAAIHIWPNLNMVGWAGWHLGKNPSEKVADQIEAIVNRHIAMMKTLDQRAQKPTSQPAATSQPAGQPKNTQSIKRFAILPQQDMDDLCGEMTLILGWNGRKVNIPGPLYWSPEGQKTFGYRYWRWAKDVRTLDFTDSKGRRWKTQAMGDLMPDFTVHRPDGTLLASGRIMDDSQHPSHWQLYDAAGKNVVFKVICREGQDANGNDTKRWIISSVYTYDPDGTERWWQVNGHGVVWSEMVNLPSGRSFFVSYAKPYAGLPGKKPYSPELLGAAEVSNVRTAASFMLIHAQLGNNDVVSHLVQPDSPLAKRMSELPSLLKGEQFSLPADKVTIDAGQATLVAERKNEEKTESWTLHMTQTEDGHWLATEMKKDPHKIGEFYVMGKVKRPGAYPLVGEEVTVKKAVAAAGMDTGKDRPRTAILIRRVPDTDSQEEMIPLDLEGILTGKTSDVSLKPNDILAIGRKYNSTWKQLPIRKTLPKGVRVNQTPSKEKQNDQPAGKTPTAATSPNPAQEATDPEPALEKGVKISGVVLLPNGKPAAYAYVALTDRNNHGIISLNDNSEGHFFRVERTSKDGRFSYTATGEPGKIVAYHESGFADVDMLDVKQAGKISLEAWGHVEGTLMIGDKLGVDEPVHLMRSLPDGRFETRMKFSANTKTDKNGCFRFDRVPPGTVQVGRIRSQEDARSGLNIHRAVISRITNVKSRKTSALKLGGTGRPIVGRLLAPGDYQGKVNWIHQGLCDFGTKENLPQPPAPPNSEAMSSSQKQAWLEEWKKTEEGKAFQKEFAKAQKKQRHFDIYLNPDGSFRVEDVPAGTYELSGMLFQLSENGDLIPESVIGEMKYEFTVPEMPGGRSDEPLDIGTYEFQSGKKKTAIQSNMQSASIRPANQPAKNQGKMVTRVYDIHSLLAPIPLDGGPALPDMIRAIQRNTAKRDADGTKLDTAVGPETVNKDGMVTRVYDVRDLLAIIPSIENSPSASWPWEDSADSRLFKEQDPNELEKTRSETRKLFLQTIQTMFSEKGWSPNSGGGKAEIQKGNLVVTQTSECHKNIQKLLERLRATRGVQIIVESRFIWMPKDIDEKMQTWLREQNLYGKKNSKNGIEGITLTSRQADTLFRKFQTYKNVRSLTVPRLTMLNGQSTYVSILASRVVPFPKPGSNEKVVKYFNQGISLHIDATTNFERTGVTMTLNPIVTRLVSKDKEVTYDMGKTDRTFSAPDACTVLISVPSQRWKTQGLKSLPGSKDEGSYEVVSHKVPGATEQLWLMVKPSIILPEQNDSSVSASGLCKDKGE